jgi:hypothetical protein
MTDDELKAFVTCAVQEGQVLDAKAYSRMTGVKASTLSRWVAAQHFERRAERLGISSDRIGTLSDSTRAALQVAKLNAVFIQVTLLAIAARAPSAQLKAIISEANAAPSEAAALDVVEQARAVRSEDIRVLAAGFKSARRTSIGSAQHIGGLLRFDVDDLLDVSPEKRSETFLRMSRLRQRLDGALARARNEWNLVDLEQPLYAITAKVR